MKVSIISRTLVNYYIFNMFKLLFILPVDHMYFIEHKVTQFIFNVLSVYVNYEIIKIFVLFLQLRLMSSGISVTLCSSSTKLPNFQCGHSTTRFYGKGKELYLYFDNFEENRSVCIYNLKELGFFLIPKSYSVPKYVCRYLYFCVYVHITNISTYRHNKNTYLCLHI